MKKELKKYLRERNAYLKRMKASAIKTQSNHSFGFWSGVEILIAEIDYKFKLGVFDDKD